MTIAATVVIVVAVVAVATVAKTAVTAVKIVDGEQNILSDDVINLCN